MFSLEALQLSKIQMRTYCHDIRAHGQNPEQEFQISGFDISKPLS